MLTNATLELETPGSGKLTVSVSREVTDSFAMFAVAITGAGSSAVCFRADPSQMLELANLFRDMVR